ncbi:MULTISPECIES: BglG family transcription antiterminator [Caproicibacterium]|jgi:mannitol operon transcriptional antiterminator|nr:PRD domain-containing protein [Caproicibacterium lactatifermentans]MDD4806880.1 PRD domain-containing protein [Oscillospiraceae bacterium]
MKELSARQKLMLRLLMEPNGMEIGALARRMEISERTVFREMSAINDVLEEKMVRIAVSRSVLKVEAGPKQRKELAQMLQDIPRRMLLTPRQRMLFISAQLLLTDEAYKSAFFSYQLHITAGTVSLYMNRIAQWMKQKGLTLNRECRCGLKVEGTEWNKRNTLVTLIYEYKPVNKILAHIYGVDSDPVQQFFFHALFGTAVIQISRDILNLVSQEQTDDILYLTSLLHTMISVKSMADGRPISLPRKLTQRFLSNGGESFDWQVRAILQQREIPASADEIVYIALHLPGKCLSNNEEEILQGYDVKADNLAKEVLYEVGKNLGVDTEISGRLRRGLSHDITLAVYRANMGIQVKNELLPQVMQHYGRLYQAVSRACKLVFLKYNLCFPADEVGFLTMEIGNALETRAYLEKNLSILIICPNGLFASHILYDKVKGIVRASDKIEVASLKEWSESTQHYDLVLSTVEIEPREGQNILVVSQFLNNQDITRIHTCVDRIRSQTDYSLQKRPAADNQPIETAEEKKLIFEMVDSLQLEKIPKEPFEQMVDRIAAELFRQHRIADPKEITHLILQREKTGSIVVPQTKVSLLHVRSDLVHSPFVGVYRIAEGEICMRGVGFVWEPVNTFLVMLARSSETASVLEKMGRMSVALIEDKTFPKMLRTGTLGELKTKLCCILTQPADTERSE